jgi:hypothetical protein
MNPTKLKLGLLLDSYEIPAWVYYALNRIAGSGDADFFLLVINEAGNVAKSTRSVYKWFNALDEKVFVRAENALEPRSAEALFAHVPVLHVTPDRQGDVDHFTPRDIDQIQGYSLDILIKFGFGELGDEILVAARYGVWSYAFEGNPHGFWEVVKGQTQTWAFLQMAGKDSGAARLLYRSSTSTYPFSPARNRNRSLWLASAFLPRQVALLHRLGEAGFGAAIKKYGPAKPPLPEKAQQPPSNLLALWLAAGFAAKNIVEFFKRKYSLDGWFLLFDAETPDSLSFGNYKKIIPPKDRFWADPHVIQKNGKHYIFVEELPYATQKGHLAVIAVDQQGNLSEPVRILEKEYHLSYPGVFEWDDKVYMVPESADNGSIDLYECTEFPARWEHRKTLMRNIKAVDTTLLFAQGKWWLFTAMAENEAAFPEVELFLFFSDDLFTGEWKAHPRNPIVSDLSSARPAGKIFTRHGKLFRPSQNCSKSYGYGFNLNEILTLSETEYEEKTVAAVIPWDKSVSGTHTYWTDGKFTVIDAYTKRRKFF